MPVPGQNLRCQRLLIDLALGEPCQQHVHLLLLKLCLQTAELLQLGNVHVLEIS